MHSHLIIRKITEDEFDLAWSVFEAVVRSGDTYAYHPETNRDEALKLWMRHGGTTFVAYQLEDSLSPQRQPVVLGTYILRPNQPGLGAHVANCAYMVHPDAQGQGVGKAMALHSIDEATAAGYEAIQYNYVVSSNTRAVALWKKLGFQIIGTSPKAFKHASLGYVDTYIMHRFLS